MTAQVDIFGLVGLDSWSKDEQVGRMPWGFIGRWRVSDVWKIVFDGICIMWAIVDALGNIA